MVLSEVIRFTLPRSVVSSTEFLKLRKHASSQEGIITQYFGYVLPDHGTLNTTLDQMCWVIQWRETSASTSRAAIRSQLVQTVAEKGDAKSLLFEFAEDVFEPLTKGLEAPVCEFAIINLASSEPLTSPDFKKSMQKTFTDCYYAKGFTGGAWAYAQNTNETDGVQVEAAEEYQVKEDKRMLACYYLGWDSVKLHDDYASTPLFDEEIDKLKPWFGKGTGLWYVSFEKHV